MKNRIVEQFEALGLPIHSVAAGVIVAKLGETRFLYYQEDEGTLTLSDEVVLGDFSDHQSVPKRVVLTLSQIGEHAFTVASKARVRSPEDVPYLVSILEGVLAFLPKSEKG